MNAFSRKGSATSAVVAVLAVLLVGGGIWYYMSDPFRTRVNESIKQGTSWTPEQIAKDPVMYLNFCEEETNKALQSLKASKIAVAQNRAKLDSMKSDAQAQVQTGTSTVSTLLAAYKSADAANVWPVTWNNTTMDKDKVKAAVVSYTKQVSIQQNLLNKTQAGLKNLEAQDSKIDQAQADAQTQLAEIKTNRELLKVNNLTSDLKDKLVTMQSAVAATVGAATENSGIPSLEQLKDQSAAQVDNAEFDKILAGTK